MFEGAKERRGLDFLKPGTTMNASPYIETMYNYLVRTHNISENRNLLQDSTPCHKVRLISHWHYREGLQPIKRPAKT